jgi:hypothetical protein
MEDDRMKSRVSGTLWQTNEVEVFDPDQHTSATDGEEVAGYRLTLSLGVAAVLDVRLVPFSEYKTQV